MPYPSPDLVSTTLSIVSLSNNDDVSLFPFGDIKTLCLQSYGNCRSAEDGWNCDRVVGESLCLSRVNILKGQQSSACVNSSLL